MKELIKALNDFQIYNPHVNLFKSLRENDKKNVGFIPAEVYYDDLKINGVKLRLRNQKLLDDILKDEKGNIDYIHFYYLMKSCKTSSNEAKIGLIINTNINYVKLNFFNS